MIFEANYKTLEKPFLLMKAFLTDTEYRTEKHAVTLEVGDEVTFSFYDPKAKLEMVYTLEEAEPTLEGVATCSMKALFDVLKGFKKSEDVILVEREDNILRIDDGVYPEEIIVLFDDENTVVTDEAESPYPLVEFGHDGIASSFQRASVILKKTDIPTDKLDTQAVYLVGTPVDTFSVHSFSIHQSYTEEFSAQILSPFTLKIPKTITSLFARVFPVITKISGITRLSQAFSDGQELLLIENEEKTIQIALKGQFLDEGQVSKSFEGVSKQVDSLFNTHQAVSVNPLTLPKKVSATTNLAIENGNLVLSEQGYSGKIIKEFIQKGGIGEESKWLELGDDGIVLIRSEEEDSKKTMVLSYRKDVAA